MSALPHLGTCLRCRGCSAHPRMPKAGKVPPQLAAATSSKGVPCLEKAAAHATTVVQ